MLAAAKGQVTAALQPDIQSAQQAITQAQTDARNKALAEEAAYGAVADLQGGDAQKVNDLYGQAANRQAAFGKGYSLGLQLIQNKTAGQSNDLLAKNGQAARMSPGPGAADVLYALGGASPASVLNNAGAAFSAAAATRPGATRGIGVQAYQSALNAGDANAKTLQGQLANIEARRPSLIQQALSGLQSSQQQNYANAIQAQYLNNTLANGVVGRTGVDPATGQPAVGYAVDPRTGKVVKQSVLDARASARKTAVAKRDDATAKALTDGDSWVQTQLAPGFQPQKVADVPVRIPGASTPAIKDASGKVVIPARPLYAKAGGGRTTNPDEAATRAVYEQTPIPKPDFNRMWTQLTAQLKRQLARFGYKPAALRAMAYDILDAYYTTTTNTPPLPGKTRTAKNTSGGTTTSTGP